MDRISVIIPVAGRSDYIYESIRSIFNSTYRNLEVIIVQDRAVENLEENIQEFSSDVVIYKRKIKNFAAAANFGFSKSTGELISFFNVNDINGKMRFEVSVKNLIDNSRAGMVFCGTTFIDNEGTFLRGVSTFPSTDSDKFLGSMLEKNWINSISTILVRRDVVNELGGFNEKFDNAEDYDLYLRIGQKTKTEYINLPLVRYRAGGNKINSLRQNHEYDQHEINVLKKVHPGDIAAGLSYLYKSEEKFRVSYGKILYAVGDIKKALLNFRKACELNSENYDAYFHIGNSYFSVGKYDLALHGYEKCLALYAEHKECLNNLGILYGLLGDKQKSRSQLKKAEELTIKQLNPLFTIDKKETIRSKLKYKIQAP